MQNDLVDKTIFLYQSLRWKGLFAKIRFWDAPYIEVEKNIPKFGKIYDVGCGEGIFSNFLGIISSKRKILGVEIDKERLAFADRGLKNVIFAYGNALAFRPNNADCIILFHVLHHLSSFEDQIKVLKNCHKGLKKSGQLIIVEVDIKPTFKYFLSWVTDHFLVPILFEKKIYSPIYFRKRQEWINLLKKLGFRVSCKDVSAGKPFSHIIYTATFSRSL